MTRPRRRVIERAHALPGRLRLRLRWLRDEPESGEPLAEHLAGLDESMEVVVRPWTGSVLCTFDPEAVTEARILAAVRHHTQVAIVEEPGAAPEPPPTPPPETSIEDGGASIRGAVFGAFRSISDDIREATEGHLDLGSLTGISFLAIGAAELLSQRTVPAPPWFNMAWWAYRTFTLSGPEESAAADDDAADMDLGD